MSEKLGITLQASMQAGNVELQKLISNLKSAGNEITSIQTKVNKLGEKKYTVKATNGIKNITETINESGKELKGTTTLTNKAFDTGKLIFYANILRGIWNKFKSIEMTAIDFNETTEKFNVSMGSATNQATNFQNRLAEAFGTSRADMMNYQSNFKNIMAGLGTMSSSTAERISESLTKMSLDYSSLFNVSQLSAASKFQSALVGGIMPIRRESGYDVSKNAVSQKAKSIGVTTKYSNLNETEKRLIRIMLLMDQMKNTGAFNDLARTIESPANQLKVLKNQLQEIQIWLGNVFMGTIGQILPYINGFLMALKEIIKMFALFTGYEPIATNTDDILQETANNTSDVADNLGTATDNAKALKKQLMGFDVLNVITTPTKSTSDNGSGIGTIDPKILSALSDYNSMMENVKMKATDIRDKIMDWLGFTKLVDEKTGEITWKLKDGEQRFTKIVDLIKTILLMLGGFVLSKGLISLINLMTGNTLTTGMINMKAAGIGFMLGGLFLIYQGIKHAIENKDLTAFDLLEILGGGALTYIGGAMTFGKGVNLGVMIGLGLTIAGVTLAYGAIKKMLKEHDFSAKNVLTAIGAGSLAFISGALTFSKILNIKLPFNLNLFSKTKNTGISTGSGDISKQISSTSTALDSTSNATDGLNTSTSNLTSKLKTLAKNLAFGLVIIAEVAAAAALIVGAIILLGYELQQVGIVWQPVIDNGQTVMIAMSIGTGILIGIGAIAGLLGKVGGVQLIINLALGTAILAEIGVAAGLFVLEIWAIGKGLDQIGIAWQPVLDNGNNITKAIAIGTGILIGIGIVAGLLGVATAGTAGLLPLAIGLGTAILLELGIAAGLFIIEIWAIGEGLQKIGEAWQPVLDNGDIIKQGIEIGTGLLIGIGTVTAALGVATVGTAGLLPLAIGLGTAMLILLKDATIDFINNLVEVADQLNNRLNPQLQILDSKFPSLISNLDDYINFMKIFAGDTWEFTKANAVAAFSDIVNTIIGWFTSNPISSFSDNVEQTYNQTVDLDNKLKIANPELQTAIWLVTNYFNFLQALDNITGRNENFKLVGGIFVNMQQVGQNLITGFVSGINSQMWLFDNAINHILDSLNNSTAWWSGYWFGSNIGWGVSQGIKDNLKSTIAVQDTSNWKTLKNFTVKAYANGGFPDMGQMFIANENGPELVGNIGSQTTVMNNQQIIQAVSQGVANAVKSVIGNQGGSYNFYLDGNQLTATVEKRMNMNANMRGS